MPRRKDMLNEKWIAGEVAKVFTGNRTTREERLKVASEWCKQNYGYVIEFCEHRPLVPMAVLLGALLEIEHPLLVVGGRRLYASLTVCSIEILIAELERRVVHIPLWITSGENASCTQDRPVSVVRGELPTSGG